MNFNEKLINLRKSKGLSQEELGAELKVSRQTISKWESCQSYPDFQRLVLLSDYFGLTLDELVKDVDVQEVREKNINSEKLDSIYSDVGKAKQFVKWYLIIAGSIGAAVLVLMLYYFAVNAGSLGMVTFLRQTETHRRGPPRRCVRAYEGYFAPKDSLSSRPGLCLSR